MTKRILVTGGRGLVGSAIRDISSLYPQYDFIFTHREEYDLTKESHIDKLFLKKKPDYVIHTAARVGGIGKNLNTPAQQYFDNILMNTYMIHYAHEHNVEKLIAFSSVCAFPADSEILKEESLHDGAPFEAHGSYAYSKRMVDVQIEAYRKQYNRQYCSVIPGNIFGENDNFNLEDGHVVPSLIHKGYLAKQNNTSLEVWGDGTPTREFLYAQDVARACVELFEKESLPQKIIVSGDQEITIKSLIERISQVYGLDNIKWLTDKPNGQMKRPSSKEILKKTLPNLQFTDIDVALENTIRWFEKNYPEVRK
tara:strand:+ start:11599 stop:12528 length:930 start_codon:yes stop_codon:yes gene_type:complete